MRPLPRCASVDVLHPVVLQSPYRTPKRSVDADGVGTNLSFMSVAEIRQAISQLSPKDYCDLMAELHPWPDDEWDLQMKSDAAAGRLDFVRRHAEKAKGEDRLVTLDRILADS